MPNPNYQNHSASVFFLKVREWVQNHRALTYDLNTMESDENEDYDEALVAWHKSNIDELNDMLVPILRGPIPDIQDVTR